jgi:hypothetical protein
VLRRASTALSQGGTRCASACHSMMMRLGVSVKLTDGDMRASQKLNNTCIRTRLLVSGHLPSPWGL